MATKDNVALAVTSDFPSRTSIRYLRDRECRVLTGLSRSTRWRLERAGQFPRRRKLSARAVGWIAAEVEQWMRERVVQGPPGRRAARDAAHAGV